MASTSAHSRLPRVGDNFETLRAFKRAVYSAAVSESFALHIHTSRVGLRCGFRCSGGGSKRQMAKQGGSGCSCTVYVRKDPNTKLYRVRRSVATHSCSLPKPGSDEAAKARVDTRAKLRALDDAGDGEDDDDDDSDDGSSSTRTFSGRLSSRPRRSNIDAPPSKRLRLIGTADEQRRADEELKKASFSGYGSRPGSKKLSKRLLKRDISSLAALRRLRLPTSDETFPALLPILLHIYAWAEQQQLNLNHDYSGSKRVVFICRPDSNKPRCPHFEIEVREVDNGRWAVTSSRQQHDKWTHACEAIKMKEGPPAFHSSSTAPPAQDASSGASSSSSSASMARSLPATTPTAFPLSVALLPPLAPEHLPAFLASLSSSSAFDTAALHFFLSPPASRPYRTSSVSPRWKSRPSSSSSGRSRWSTG